MLALLLSHIALFMPAPVICQEDQWCWNPLIQGNHVGRLVYFQVA